MVTQALYSVVGLMIQSGKVLAVSRKDNHSDIGLPGGKIDPGETPEQALARELMEEIGVRVKEFRVVFEDLDRVVNGESRPCRAYLIETWEGEPVSKETAIIDWVYPSKLLEPTNSFHEYNQKLFGHIGPIWH
jgi:8-oxo-dGTP diphosphatase